MCMYVYIYIYIERERDRLSSVTVQGADAVQGAVVTYNLIVVVIIAVVT